MKVSVAVDILKGRRSQIDINEARELIRLLEEGEAYRQMNEKFGRWLENNYWKFGIWKANIHDKWNIYKQKYFPKVK